MSENILFSTLSSSSSYRASTHHCESLLLPLSHHKMTATTSSKTVVEWLLHPIILILTFPYAGPLHDWTIEPMRNIALEQNKENRENRNVQPLLKKFRELKEQESSFIKKAVRNFSAYEPYTLVKVCVGYCICRRSSCRLLLDRCSRRVLACKALLALQSMALSICTYQHSSKASLRTFPGTARQRKWQP